VPGAGTRHGVSYDLQAYKLPAGMTPETFVALLEESEEEDQGAVISAEERRALAEALAALDPAAERFDTEDGAEVILDTTQVLIGERDVVVNAPYHGAASTPSPIDRAFACADVLIAHGLIVWDPQADALVPAGDDHDAARDRFSATSDLTAELLLGDQPPSGRTARWQLWKRP
jgi:hypothetical protein